jgi:hypothetical protein
MLLQKSMQGGVDDPNSSAAFKTNVAQGTFNQTLIVKPGSHQKAKQNSADHLGDTIQHQSRSQQMAANKARAEEKQ